MFSFILIIVFAESLKCTAELYHNAPLSLNSNQKHKSHQQIYGAPKWNPLVSVYQQRRNTQKKQQQIIYIIPHSSQQKNDKKDLIILPRKGRMPSITYSSHGVHKHRMVEANPIKLPPLKTIYLLNRDSTYDTVNDKITLKYHLGRHIPFEKIDAVRFNFRPSNTTRLISMYVQDKNKTFKAFFTENLQIVNLALTYTTTSKWKAFDLTSYMLSIMKKYNDCKSFFIYVEVSCQTNALSEQLQTSYFGVDIKRKNLRRRRSHVIGGCRVHKKFLSFRDLGMKIQFPFQLKYRKGIYIDYCSGSCKAIRYENRFLELRNSKKCCVATRRGRGIWVYYKDMYDGFKSKHKFLDINVVNCECR